jgi:hypothetical protein
MKKIIALSLVCLSLACQAAVPTEEGLLKNLNNAEVQGNLITIKTMIQNTSPAVGSVSESEQPKADYYKLILSFENPNQISFLQIGYSNAQMQNSQIRDVKYIPDFLSAIKKEKTPEKGLFNAALMMLSSNHSQGVEAFLEKSGTKIVRNKDILNEEKMKLLRSYRTYLANNKGKGDSNSPLNPTDLTNKAKVLELFRANTFIRSKNIELVKADNEFMWLVDWKSVKGYFTNEERRLRKFEYTTPESIVKLEAQDYILFNGVNEFPKYIHLRDSKNQTTKIQVLSVETKMNREKKLAERFEEAQKSIASLTKTAGNSAETNYSFLF